jgi:ectoine hydroxylase-related dioxygenase (phytanoyl-CoA dioxygenase family)
MPIARFDRAAPVADVAAAVRAQGAAIVERAVGPEVVAAVLAETEPYRERTAAGTDSFSGRNTRRTGSLVARSESVRAMVLHPTVIGVCDEILGANSTSYQLHVTQVIDIGPGEPAQFLHRDQWAWDTFPFPRGFDVEISTIWAMHDFTDLNGATRVVPGSNQWPDDARPTPDQTEPAEMPAGSVLIYSGSVFHGGGANRSDGRRVAVNIDYCLGWLRQEENQYLACPPDIARHLPVELARLLGYARGAYALGYFGDTQDPMEALHPDAAAATGFGGDVAPRPVTSGS